MHLMKIVCMIVIFKIFTKQYLYLATTPREANAHKWSSFDLKPRQEISDCLQNKSLDKNFR